MAYRSKRLSSRCKLTREQVMASWKLYESGMSSATIAELLWEKFGYASASTLNTSLTVLWKSYGKELRQPHETKMINSKPCRGCGCHVDQRTRGCKTCAQRHQRRNKATAHPWPEIMPMGRRDGLCKTCRGPLDSFTDGCSTCDQRYRKRKTRRKLQEAKGPGRALPSPAPVDLELAA